MITDQDKALAKELEAFISSKIGGPNFTDQDWKLVGYTELINRMVHSLSIAPFSYRPVSDEAAKERFYTAECDKCGWWGGSNLLNGGSQIADTGCYGDMYCPVCNNSDIGEKEL